MCAIPVISDIDVIPVIPVPFEGENGDQQRYHPLLQIIETSGQLRSIEKEWIRLFLSFLM